jgi:hypothetical protein
LKLLLADFILVAHFAFVLFVVLSLPLIWVGAETGWRWIRSYRYRVTHLAAIIFVSAEAAAGVWCPLTVWEDALRGTTPDRSFVARWTHALLFYDLPAWVFTTAYFVFAVLVALTWWRVPPRKAQAAQ